MHVQEEAIASWFEAMEEKKAELDKLAKDKELMQVELFQLKDAKDKLEMLKGDLERL